MALSIIELPSFQNFKSLFDMQYFVCPLCPFKWHSRQGFVDHAWQKHPVLVEKMKILQDNSMDEVVVPWKKNQMNSNNDLTEKSKIQEEEKTMFEIKEKSSLNILMNEEESTSNDITEIAPDDKNYKELVCNDCGKNFSSKDSLKIHSFMHMNMKLPTTKNTDETSDAQNDEDSAELNFVLRFTNSKCDKCKLLFNILSEHPCTKLEKIKMYLDVKTPQEKDTNDYDDAQSLSDDNSLANDATSLKSKLEKTSKHNSQRAANSLKKPNTSHKNKERTNPNTIQYKCHVCGKTFTKITHLKEHINIIHEGKKLQCPKCDKYFQNKYNLSTHLQTVHEDIEISLFPEKSELDKTSKFVEVCAPSLETDPKDLEYYNLSENEKTTGEVHENLLQHDGHPKKKFECEVCGKFWVSIESLRVHMDNFHANNVEKYAPLESNSTDFAVSENENAANSEVSEDLHHDGRPKKFKCKICGKLSVSIQSLRVHIGNIHIKKPSKCEKCGKVFNRKHEWNKHVALHGDDDLKCDYCDMSFVKNDQLDHHIYTTHKGYKEEDPRYVCATCKKAFTQCNELKTHIRRVHEGVKRVKKHQCEICGMKYHHASNLTHHVQRDHEKMNMRTNICDTCGNGFTTLAALRAHIRVIHDGIKDFSCDQCGRLFAKCADLKAHFTAHHANERNYHCEQCGKTFSWKSVLKAHIKQVHEHQRPNKCPTCGNGFFCKSDMQRHIDSVHLGKKDVWKRKKK